MRLVWFYKRGVATSLFLICFFLNTSATKQNILVLRYWVYCLFMSIYGFIFKINFYFELQMKMTELCFWWVFTIACTYGQFIFIDIKASIKFFQLINVRKVDNMLFKHCLALLVEYSLYRTCVGFASLNTTVRHNISAENRP